MTEGAGMDHAGLRRLLAHGWPVLLVDRVLALQPGVCLTAVKAVTGSEPCYRDLPRELPADRYSYPVPLMLESFGQAAAVLWLQTAAAQHKASDGLLMFAAARNCVIEGAAYPGDVLRHEVRLDHVMDGAAFATGETWVGERRVARMSLFTAVARPVEQVSHGLDDRFSTPNTASREDTR